MTSANAVVLPETITDEAMLDELMSRPLPRLVDLMSRLNGDLAVLGIAGKMGISLGRMAVRACQEAGIKKKIFGISRFSDPAARQQVEAAGVLPVACDLLDAEAVNKLPRTALAIFMAGRKFGTSGSADITWAMNTVAPANVARHFAGSRISVFSTGCVYPMVAVASGGCAEDISPSPVGDYAQSTLGRERVFEYFSRIKQTPICILRLNYSLDLRYGVLHDLARQIMNGEPVNLSSPAFNGIWQGDANAQALLALDCCGSPAQTLNITGPEIVSTRWAALELGKYLGCEVRFTGTEGTHCYLNNAAKAHELFGYPSISMATLLKWTAAWVKTGGRSLGKPTHFETTNGSF